MFYGPAANKVRAGQLFVLVGTFFALGCKDLKGATPSDLFSMLSAAAVFCTRGPISFADNLGYVSFSSRCSQPPAVCFTLQGYLQLHF